MTEKFLRHVADADVPAVVGDVQLKDVFPVYVDSSFVQLYEADQMSGAAKLSSSFLPKINGKARYIPMI